MIEILSNNNGVEAAQNQSAKPRKIFKMTSNERMGGSVPIWQQAETSKDKVIETLSNATGGIGGADSFENALALQSQNEGLSGNQDDEFGFGDLVDMVNPLQHIPLVGHLYRDLTGDDIKPVARIVGGGVFGGPAGVASGIVNTVVEEETGKDIAGNALSMVIGEDDQTLTPQASGLGNQATAKSLYAAQEMAAVDINSWGNIAQEIEGELDVVNKKNGEETATARASENFAPEKLASMDATKTDIGAATDDAEAFMQLGGLSARQAAGIEHETIRWNSPRIQTREAITTLALK